jgi:membrane protease subunit HflK
MAWNNNGGAGGPWGGPSGDGGKRGGGRGPWGGGPSGPSGPSRPPGGGPGSNIEDLFKKGSERFKGMMPGGIGSPRGIVIVLLVALIGWLLTGFYRVNPNEAGIEMIFGRMVGQPTANGLHWNWPAPIGRVLTPRITDEQRTEIGFVTGRAGARGQEREAQMLTGDENIIEIQAVVIWRVDTRVVNGQTPGIRNFVFNIRSQERTVKDVAEAALRDIVGRNEFEAIRTGGRVKIEGEVKALMQQILDSYGTGIEIRNVQLQKTDPPQSVLNAFRDVQAARADKERLINEAQGYYNGEVEKAKGVGERTTREADAYKEERIAAARGEASRFLALFAEYERAKDITRQRLYLEAMREILQRMDKLFLDSRAGGPVPFISIDPSRRPVPAGVPGTGGNR